MQRTNNNKRVSSVNRSEFSKKASKNTDQSGRRLLVDIKLDDKDKKYIGYQIKKNDKELGYIKDIGLKDDDYGLRNCLQLMDKDGNDCDTKVVKFITKNQIVVLTDKETKRDIFTENTNPPIKAFTINPSKRVQDKKEDKRCIQGVSLSALEYSKTLYKDSEQKNAMEPKEIIEQFEKEMSTKKYSIHTFSQSPNQRLHANFSFKGHGQVEEKTKENFVKIYANKKDRIVYDYNEGTGKLTFNQKKSIEESH
jgi:hypothetical protein